MTYTVPQSDDEILEQILDRERAYSDNAADHGRATAWGISSKFHPDAWTHGPPAREIAKAIYRDEYLAPFAEVEPIEVRAQVVDIAVNHGVRTAKSLLALACNQTERPVGQQLAVERLRAYARIVKRDPSQAEFITGWIDRGVWFLR